MITRSISFYLNCFSYGLRVSWSPSSLCVLWCAQCLECYSRKASSIRVNTPGFLFFVFSFLGRARWALLRQSFFFAPLSLLLFFTCFFSPFLGKGSATKKDLPPYVFFFLRQQFPCYLQLGLEWRYLNNSKKRESMVSPYERRMPSQTTTTKKSITFFHIWSLFVFWREKRAASDHSRRCTIPPPPGASNWGQHS